MGRRLIVDTNLLVLLVVGSTSRAYVERHKRCKPFTVNDFEDLVLLVDGSELIVTTGILTETSSLTRQIGEPYRSEIGLYLKEFIERATEFAIPSRGASQRPEFLRLGLTDSAILDLAVEDAAFVSTDGALCALWEGAGRQVIYFNLRAAS